MLSRLLAAMLPVLALAIEQAAAWSPTGEIGRWVAGNPAVALIDGTLVVHGGIGPAYANRSVDAINRAVDAALRAQDAAPAAIINDENGPLWYRGLTTGTPAAAAQVDASLQAEPAVRMVIAHTPVLSGIAVQDDGRLIRIDTGISAVFRGTPSYFEIVDGVATPHAVPRPARHTPEGGGTMTRTIWLATAALAGSAAATDGPRPLFASGEPLALTLRGPFDGMPRGDATAPGTMTVAGDAAPIPVTLSTRGVTRRDSDVCQFPPVRVTFPAKPAQGSPFAGQRTLKLVTHCRASESFQQYILLEYAAYRMGNLLTPLSYDVRLATITYQDARGRPLTTRLGFFIEDERDVAKRNGLHVYKTKARLSPGRLSAVDAARGAVFEDLIGNLDWSMIAGPAGTNCCHNVKLLGAKDGAGPLVPLVYDYDFSGLVDAPYATSPQGMDVDNVRVRRYRGYCGNEAAARAALAEVSARRAELLAVLDQVPQLAGPTKRKAAAYLNAFFDQASTPAGVARMLSTCLR